MNGLNKVIPLILCLALAVTVMCSCGVNSETSIVSDVLYGKVISASKGTLNVELGVLTRGFGLFSGSHGNGPMPPEGRPDKPNSSDDADKSSKAPKENSASGFVEADNQENSSGGGKNPIFGAGFSSCGITMKISVSSEAEYKDGNGNSITVSDIKSGDIVKIEITESKASAITLVDALAYSQMLPESSYASDLVNMKR